MLDEGKLAWVAVVAALCLPGPLAAQKPVSTEITFTLASYNASSEWPVSIREIAIGGRPVQIDRPMRVAGDWLPTVTMTLLNVSPKTIVRGGMDITFFQSGNGTEQHPYLGSQSVKGRVPKIVYLGANGYHLPPWWDRDVPLQIPTRGRLRLSFIEDKETQDWLARAAIVKATLSFDNFYFADNSRWSAGEYLLAPTPPSRTWTRVSLQEFLRSAKSR